MWQNEQDAKAEARCAKGELGVHSRLWLEGRQLAVVSGRPEAPVGEARAWTSPRQWESLGA